MIKTLTIITPEVTCEQAKKILNTYRYWSYYDRGYHWVSMYIKKTNPKAKCLNSISGRDLDWSWCSSSSKELTEDSNYIFRLEHNCPEDALKAWEALLQDNKINLTKDPAREPTPGSDEEEYW